MTVIVTTFNPYVKPSAKRQVTGIPGYLTCFRIDRYIVMPEILAAHDDITRDCRLVGEYIPLVDLVQTHISNSDAAGPDDIAATIAAAISDYAGISDTITLARHGSAHGQQH